MSEINYPDEFENNNPFAEPESTSVTQAFEQEPRVEAEQEHQSTSIEQPLMQEPQGNNTAPAGDTEEYGRNRLSQDELKKLIPERFTNKYGLQFQLVDIERNKPENPILRLEVQVRGLPKFRQQTYKELRRTYNEIVKFNKYLSISNLETFVPVIPSSKTSYPSGGEDEKKQLMKVWQEWFDRITSNPILIRDDEFHYFIENDFGYSVINNNRKSSVASGLMRKTLKQFSVPPDPYEELAYFRPTIKSAYLISQKLHKLLERSCKTEKQLSIHVYDMSNKLGVLSDFENTHPGMKNMWDKLGKVIQVTSDLLLIDSINEMAILGDGVQILINDFYEVKEALTNRYLIMRELVQAEAQTSSKHIQANKIRSKVSLDPIKVGEALRSLESATKVQNSLELQVKRISGEMLYEKKEFTAFVDGKFKSMIKTYVLHKVEHHRKMLKNFEKIRLDVRSVDERGGLSRLNRENLKNLKHNLFQSQSSAGDTWTSRTFRSLEKEEESKQLGRNNEPLSPITVDAKNAASILGVATF
ncbi:VPS17 [Candida oxycetoniae]|uniref:Vacuolar protein sorting-associated protein 17 n=1 Tax=Candida oxycetoniae TaxID=497107 RepID=A0AAI9WXX7_9ASCO|nr:VPS17 [Candida oxycetoniae]KAI3404693.2 VPS17 [Candida oxycetoniae]